jgi:hypothetical protein
LENVLHLALGQNTGGTGGNGCPEEDAIGFKSALLRERIIIPFPRLTMSDHEIFENHQPVIARERNCPHWGLSEAGGIQGSFTGLWFSQAAVFGSQS